MIVLFWQCGWNIVTVILDLVNDFEQLPKSNETESLIVLRKFSDKENLTELQNKIKRKKKKPKGLSHPNLVQIENSDLEEKYYSFQSLLISYLIIQLFLLCFYLGQNYFYNFVKKQNFIIKLILLKFHIFFLASIYIIQWDMIWTIWDQYTFDEWYIQLFISLIFFFALIVINGNSSDLVCAPFIHSYDSIECCLQFSCPFLTEKVSWIL